MSITVRCDGCGIFWPEAGKRMVITTGTAMPMDLCEDCAERVMDTIADIQSDVLGCG